MLKNQLKGTPGPIYLMYEDPNNEANNIAMYYEGLKIITGVEISRKILRLDFSDQTSHVLGQYDAHNYQIALERLNDLLTNMYS
ncbi:hypothetical protein [Cyanothece sp. BG0011]|uniref:hypothetical protein n=1 Tax=Cyanothece sp. BG0011 TaxID=2082950 RepID=UPI000D1DD87A|nr:hypothetical protein [Cyanothece sp. BG0011]